jgi:hypothetical protein
MPNAEVEKAAMFNTQSAVECFLLDSEKTIIEFAITMVVTIAIIRILRVCLWPSMWLL